MPVEVTFKGILSDMDGTLVDSTPAVEGALSAWCVSQGIKPEDFFEHSHGVRTQDNIKRFARVPKLGADMTEEEIGEEVIRLEDNIAAMGAKIAKEGGKGIFALPGVPSLLEKLREGNARWAVVTSATRKYALAALETSKISPPLPPVLITAGDCTHGKPHPEPYLNGLAALNSATPPEGQEVEELKPSDILVLEDAPSGLASGLAAGCSTLAVCTGQSIEKIRKIKATYKVVDLDRVEVVKCSYEGITLRFKTLEEEDEEAEKAGKEVEETAVAKEAAAEAKEAAEVGSKRALEEEEKVEDGAEDKKKRRKTLENGDAKAVHGETNGAVAEEEA